MQIIEHSKRFSATQLLAMVAGFTAGMRIPSMRFPTPKRQRNYPSMVVSPPEEIAAWNATVHQRKAERHARRLEAEMLAAQVEG